MNRTQRVLYPHGTLLGETDRRRPAGSSSTFLVKTRSRDGLESGGGSHLVDLHGESLFRELENPGGKGVRRVPPESPDLL